MDNQCGNFVGKIQFPELNKEFPLLNSPMNNNPELIQPSTWIVSLKRESLRSVRLKERAEIQAYE